MSDRLPFNKRERRRLSQQWGYGKRPVNDWGSGDLPAPYAEGDIVQLVAPEIVGVRLSSRTDAVKGDYLVVSAGFSIGEGDDWYFRVSKGDGNSDRLHVIAGDVDYMAAFTLVDTSDPDGLARREKMLADGWVLPRRLDRGRQAHERRPNIDQRATAGA